jgi:AraC-like DNA-binding protein
MSHEPLLAAAFVPLHDHAAFSSRSLHVPTALHAHVRALVAAEVGAIASHPMFVAPHESMVLTVQLGRATDACIEAKGEHGQNSWVTGIRECTGSFVPTGRCVTLFALLTPLGVVQLLDSQPLSSVPRIRARLAELLDRRTTIALESAVALAPTIDAKLRVFALWLEVRLTASRQQSGAALRAARAAMQLLHEPGIALDELARQAAVSRRQLERHFAHWFGTSPRHLARVARLQSVSRHAQQGAALADIAAHTGFADQAHMTRVVRQLTGLTPRLFVQSRRSPLAQAFRAATRGTTVYL